MERIGIGDITNAAPDENRELGDFGKLVWSEIKVVLKNRINQLVLDELDDKSGPGNVSSSKLDIRYQIDEQVGQAMDVIKGNNEWMGWIAQNEDNPENQTERVKMLAEMIVLVYLYPVTFDEASLAA